MNEPGTELLVADGLTKAFGSTVACDAVDLVIAEGEIHALLGENGAGKSTLVKMLFGALQPDSGSLSWRGKRTSIGSPSAAKALGIGMVFQHFSLFEPLTVAENIALALDGERGLRGIAERARDVSERYRLPVDPNALVGDLSAGERQRVELVRALMQDPRLLILDEPTSVLTPQEADALFETLRRMRGEGRSVLYISHRLEEVQRLCDRATVLRRGKVVASCDPKSETVASLATMMVGSTVADVVARNHDEGAVVLRLSALSATPSTPFAVPLQEIDLEVRAGEIVCIAGVAGNGQGEFFEVVSGERTDGVSGSVAIDGMDVTRLGISGRRTVGAAFVPEERIGHGSVAEMALSQNLLLARHASDRERFCWGGGTGGIRSGALRSGATRIIEEMDVRIGSKDPAAGSLSGGNLQKFVVGRELDRRPDLLVVDQPSWGVDAGAASSLRQALIDHAADGAAILVISQDLDEVFQIATHVCVMDEGRVSPKVPVEDTTREIIGLQMGGKRELAA